MSFFDWIITAIVLIAALFGLRNGALKSVLLIAGVFIAMLLSAQFAGRIVPAFTHSITNKAVITAIGYVIVFVGMMIAVSVISRIASVAMAMTFTGWINRIAGMVTGLLVGILISLALTVFLARLAYVFDSADRGNQSALQKAVEEHVGHGLRSRVDKTLTASSLVPVLIDISKAIPGDAFGLVPADFRTAFSILETRIDNG